MSLLQHAARGNNEATYRAYAALLNEAGIPAVCFGPGDISLAHAAEEYIPLDEIDRAATVLTEFARSWCS